MIWGYLGAVALLTPGFVYAYKQRWVKRFLILVGILIKDDPFGKHARVKKMLAELRVESRADRAHVVQYHNGDYYDNQSSIKKFTYCYEDLKNGISSTVSSYQNCLVSSYIDGLELLMNEDKPVNKLRFDDLDSCLYKSKMIDDGVHLHVGVPLRGKIKGELKIIGFILLSYNSDRVSQRCSFDALAVEGHHVDNDTHEYVQRTCDGTCVDCRFQRYIPLMEVELAK